MHQKIKFFAGLVLFLSCVILVGCLGGSGESSGPVVPTEYVSLSGTLVAPAQIESSLLPNMLQNTDSQVRSAYQKAAVYVNGAQNTLFSISPLSSTSEWQFRIPSVAKASDGKYRVEVVVGKINLKAMVKQSEMERFKINAQTTAILMLADATGQNTDDLIASFPSFISNVENSFLEMCKIEAGQHNGSVVQSATLTKVIQDQKSFFTELGGIQTTGKLAYLQPTNDIDGDGIDDVKFQSNTDNTRIRLLTALSSHTSMLDNVSSLSAYSNERLLQDFKDSLVSDNRYFAGDAKNFALGLYLKKSALGDVYLKLLVHRIDLAEGVFKGAVAEYELVETQTTAISSGTKTLLLQGADPVEGAARATNFITDTDPGPYVLTFISAEAGLGCSSGDTRLVKAKEISVELDQYKGADDWLDGGNYSVNTTEAIKKYENRSSQVGDVFSAYFPNTKHYALFRIKSINSTSVTVDFIVNVVENEPSFRG